MKYLERITKTEEERTNESNLFINESQSINCAKQILDAKINLSKISSQIEEAKSSKDLNLEDIFDLECKLKVAKAKLDSFKKNTKELF